jgi:hypothetical protein
MVCCFSNHTSQTSLLPEASLGTVNATKAAAAQKTAIAATNLRSNSKRNGPCTLNELEELIGCLVQTSAANGYKRLLPHSNVELFFKPGSSDKHINMLKESANLQQASSVDSTRTIEQWRRYLGQQLMLLAELITVCVPAYFQDNAKLTSTLGKRKACGAVRSDMNLHDQMFVSTAAKTDTSLTRSMALQFAAVARVCDVQYGSTDTNLFLTMSGLTLHQRCARQCKMCTTSSSSSSTVTDRCATVAVQICTAFTQLLSPKNIVLLQTWLFFMLIFFNMSAFCPGFCPRVSMHLAAQHTSLSA